MIHQFDELPALVERLEQMDPIERPDALWLAVQESEAGHWTAKSGRVMIELHGIVACAESDEAAARAWYRDARCSRRVTECGRAA
ncbi:hypothetical protein [Limimaricola cinnabarinus]|uniref:hypothetical protein n=1 Tax=Limimaricola cinnabarinus TaxID=1125964 RepID=UPI002FDF1E70